MPSKKQINYQLSTLDMHYEVGQGAEGMGGSQQQQQPSSSVQNSSQLPPNQRHIHLVEVKFC